MLKKYSVTIRGHRTSLTLEPEFWDGLKDIATRRSQSMAALITAVDNKRGEDENLSSALRLRVLDDLQKRLQQT
ncbi:MAG: ribbon-helix-helix domain-containing protein [Pseudomonadota bacterium]